MARKIKTEDGITAEDYYIKIYSGKVFVRLTQNAYKQIKAWGEVVNCEYYPDRLRISPEDGVNRTTPVKKKGYYWLVFSVNGDLPYNWKNGLYLGGFTDYSLCILFPKENKMPVRITKGRGPHNIRLTELQYKHLGSPSGLLVAVVDNAIVLSGSDKGYKIIENKGIYNVAITHGAVTFPGPQHYRASNFNDVTLDNNRTITIHVHDDQEYREGFDYIRAKPAPYTKESKKRKSPTKIPIKEIVEEETIEELELEDSVTAALNLLNNLPAGYHRAKHDGKFQVYRALYHAN